MFNRINYSAERAFNSGIIQRHFSYAGIRKCVTRLQKRLTIATAEICSARTANPDLRF